MKKQNIQLKQKVNQQAHELKKAENVNQKLKNQAKIFDKHANLRNKLEITETLGRQGPMLHGGSADSDFTLLISKSHSSIEEQLKNENSELRDCLKMLQKELFDIVTIKTEAFKRRYNTEFREEADEKYTNHDLEEINGDVMNMHFDNAGPNLISTFQANIQKLRNFLQRMDKQSDELFQIEEGSELEGENQFKNIRSINQMKTLLQNY